jgi:hypothetical protein
LYLGAELKKNKMKVRNNSLFFLALSRRGPKANTLKMSILDHLKVFNHDHIKVAKSIAISMLQTLKLNNKKRKKSSFYKVLQRIKFGRIDPKC